MPRCGGCGLILPSKAAQVECEASHEDRRCPSCRVFHKSPFQAERCEKGHQKVRDQKAAARATQAEADEAEAAIREAEAVISGPPVS